MTTSPSHKTLFVLLAAMLLAGAVTAISGDAVDDTPPPLPAVPQASGVELVLARPFTLDTPYVHTWSAEQPSVSAGVALVLRVEDHELLHPRQAAEPVLYVGAQTAERLNHGHESGHVVAIVPAAVDADGQVTLDLASTPIFFGDPELPERIDTVAAREQLVKALARGVMPAAPGQVQSVLEAQVRFADDYQLRQWAADLIERWSPQEGDLVAGLRVERLTR